MEPQGPETTAEKMRIVTANARENAQLRAAQEAQEQEVHIDATVRAQRSNIDMIIAEAADMGKNHAKYNYSERISASLQSRDEVIDIKTFADTVAKKLTNRLQSNGYGVVTQSREVVDYRDHPDSPPEYYDTTFTINW